MCNLGALVRPQGWRHTLRPSAQLFFDYVTTPPPPGSWRRAKMACPGHGPTSRGPRWAWHFCITPQLKPWKVTDPVRLSGNCGLTLFDAQAYRSVDPKPEGGCVSCVGNTLSFNPEAGVGYSRIPFDQMQQCARSNQFMKEVHIRKMILRICI